MLLTDLAFVMLQCLSLLTLQLSLASFSFCAINSEVYVRLSCCMFFESSVDMQFINISVAMVIVN